MNLTIGDFGWAWHRLKEGERVFRSGWNGKGMFLYLVNGNDFSTAFRYGYGEYAGEPRFEDSIAIKTAQNTISVGWKPTNLDMFANDWEVVE
ncbi:DUF2829 domain-containing protein [Bacillus thuringiensis]|uniref:DUF2829 domain-containing protein n=1 Tax=Bacillus thuringiensis TaxID=1428 RepID=UPI002DBE6121|nr:DUF2829 domain-containing protein [Bacillus thuringiensis]MEC3031124.1 DUF2829 domain-containing protein [Bacillus thuringiensis]